MSTGQGKKPTHIVALPYLQALVPWTEDQAFEPFCSDRCRLIDLGAWAEGRHHIPGDGSHDEGIDDEY